MDEDLTNIETKIHKIKSTKSDTPSEPIKENIAEETVSDNDSDKVEISQHIEKENLPAEQNNQTYVKAIGQLDKNDFFVKIDKNKDYREQATDMAEAAAVIAATQSEEVREEMIRSSGEELVGKTRAKAAKARAEYTEAVTTEQKSKRDLYQSLLETFGAYKHHPEWLRKIIVGMFTLPYLLLLFIIGLPTGIVKFTIERIDDIFIKYDNVDDNRKPKVRFTTWLLFSAGAAAAIILPILKHFNII